MEEILAYRQGLLSALWDVVPDVSQLAAAIPFEEWYVPLGLEAPSPHYTLAHLRELETQFINLLHRLQNEEFPRLTLFDDVSWMMEYYDPTEQVPAILEEFSCLRKQEVQWLQELSSGTWSRFARHPWWGIRTLQWWVELQLDYSHQHIRELSAFLPV